MLKSIKIIAKNFKSGLVRNIIMIVFVALAVYFMNLSLSEFMHQEYINNFVKDCGLYDNYMYVTYPDKAPFSKAKNTRDVWEKELNMLDELKRESVITDWFWTANYSVPLTERQNSSGEYTDRVRFYTYPQEFASDLNFPVSAGVWFDKYEFNEDAIPVVVGSDLKGRLKVGERISLPSSDKEYLVIGVLERNTMILSIGAGGNGMDLNSVFNSGNDAIIAADNEIDEMFLHGAVVKVPAENSRYVFEKIGDISYVFTFERLAQTAYESNRFLTEMQTTLFVLMLTVCIAGVSSSNLLATISCKKRYAIFFMCGMDWKTAVRITFTESVIKLILPAIIGYGLFINWCVEREYWQLRVTSLNVIVTIIFLSVIFTMTSLLPLLDVKRTSPVRTIVEM